MTAPAHPAFVAPIPSKPRAMGAMLGASAFVAGSTLAAKWLGTQAPALHPLQVSAGRFLFAFVILLTFAAILRPRLHRPNMPLHGARSLAGWGGTSLMFAAVTFIPMADATAISFLNPVFAMIFAFLVLSEKVGPIRWAAAVIALIGAAILLRPGPDTFQPAALLALGAAVILGVEITIIKFLSGREPPFQILLINNGIGVCISLLAASFFWQWPTGPQWAGMAAVGLLMVGAQTLYIQAMRAADASFVVPFAYATLVFAALYDYIAFGTQLDLVSWLGAGVILTGAVLLAWREAINRTRT